MDVGQIVEIGAFASYHSTPSSGAEAVSFCHTLKVPFRKTLFSDNVWYIGS